MSNVKAELLNAPKLCITGAAGIAATLIRPLLRRRYRLTLFTQTAIDVCPGESNVIGDLRSRDDVESAVDGAHAVIHLGGISTEGPFESMVDANILGTHHVLEAARVCGVDRLLIASSMHVIGGVATDAAAALPADHVKPTSFYGASKVAVEAVSATHAHKYSLSVVLARIGTILEAPLSRRHLATWLSPSDMVRLVDTAVGLHNPGSWPIWAISANTRRWVSLAPGHALGYYPKDDAERYAAEVLAIDDDPSLKWPTVGGPWYGPEERER